MPSVNDSYPSKYLKASDLNDTPLTLQISDVSEETVGQGDQAEKKLVCYFRGEEKGMVLNKTNATTIADQLGDETDDWIGQSITLFPTQVDFGGRQVEAIRVKKRSAKPAKTDRRKPDPLPANNEEFDETS